MWSLLWAVGTGHAATDVLVNNYDNLRTGANLSEPTLTMSNVGPETFGRLYSYAVDGAVQSQPLIVTGLNLPSGGVGNVVYVATLSNFGLLRGKTCTATPLPSLGPMLQ